MPVGERILPIGGQEGRAKRQAPIKKIIAKGTGSRREGDKGWGPSRQFVDGDQLSAITALPNGGVAVAFVDLISGDHDVDVRRFTPTQRRTPR
jgi:hypothetical protein